MVAVEHVVLDLALKTLNPVSVILQRRNIINFYFGASSMHFLNVSTNSNITDVLKS